MPSAVANRASACSCPTTRPTQAITHANRPIWRSCRSSMSPPRVRWASSVARRSSVGSSTLESDLVSTLGWTRRARRPPYARGVEATTPLGWRDAWLPAVLLVLGAVELCDAAAPTAGSPRSGSRRSRRRSLVFRRVLPAVAVPVSAVALMLIPLTGTEMDEAATPILFYILGDLQPGSVPDAARRADRPRAAPCVLVVADFGFDAERQRLDRRRVHPVAGDPAVRLRPHLAQARRPGRAAGRPAGGDPRPGGARRARPDRPRAARRDRPLGQRDGRADRRRPGPAARASPSGPPSCSRRSPTPAGRRSPRPAGCCT